MPQSISIFHDAQQCLGRPGGSFERESCLYFKYLPPNPIVLSGFWFTFMILDTYSVDMPDKQETTSLYYGVFHTHLQYQQWEDPEKYCRDAFESLGSNACPLQQS